MWRATERNAVGKIGGSGRWRTLKANLRSFHFILAPGIFSPGSMSPRESLRPLK